MKRSPSTPSRAHHADVRQALERANQLTMRYNHDHLGSEHLLAGLLEDAGSPAVRLLRDAGADPRRIRERLLASFVPGSEMVTASRLPRSPCLVAALDRAESEADALGHAEVDARHLLLGLARGDGPAAEALRKAGVDVASLRTRLGKPGHAHDIRGAQAPGGNGAGV
jgi:ATP-dependent Clp protease ATP-binding subunit ClpC